MRALSFYDDLSDLCNNMYHSQTTGYKNFQFVENHTDLSGLNISLYQLNEEYVFVIHGTQGIAPNDVYSDIQLLNKKIPAQYKRAKLFYQGLKDKYTPLIFAGYSLGGSIAQMLGNEYGNETVCFEPFGVGDIVSAQNTDNIINFGNIYDGIFMINVSKQLGKVYLTKVTTPPLELPINHFGSNYGKPSTATEYVGERSENAIYAFYHVLKQTVEKVVEPSYKKYLRPKYDWSKPYIKQGIKRTDSVVKKLKHKLKSFYIKKNRE